VHAADGDLLPCRDWHSVLAQQCGWLQRLLDGMNDQYEVVLSQVLKCMEYPAPGKAVGEAMEGGGDAGLVEVQALGSRVGVAAGACVAWAHEEEGVMSGSSSARGLLPMCACQLVVLQVHAPLNDPSPPWLSLPTAFAMSTPLSLHRLSAAS
jgi:hypothetical protein